MAVAQGLAGVKCVAARDGGNVWPAEVGVIQAVPAQSAGAVVVRESPVPIFASWCRLTRIVRVRIGDVVPVQAIGQAIGADELSRGE